MFTAAVAPPNAVDPLTARCSSCETRYSYTDRSQVGMQDPTRLAPGSITSGHMGSDH